jgi:hypothetical protein
MMALRQRLVTPATVSGAGPTGAGNWVRDHPPDPPPRLIRVSRDRI